MQRKKVVIEDIYTIHRREQGKIREAIIQAHIDGDTKLEEDFKTLMHNNAEDFKNYDKTKGTCPNCGHRSTSIVSQSGLSNCPKCNTPYVRPPKA